MPPQVDQVKQHFEQPRIYLRRSFNIGIRARIVQHWLGAVHDASILDVGCGDGSISLPLLEPNNRLTMLDLSRSMLDLSRSRAPAAAADRIQYVNASFLEHTFAERFDIVLCIGVLAHVPALEATFRKLSEVCKPGGKCIVQLTDAGKLLGKLHNATASLHRRLFRSHGYQTNRMTAGQIVTLAATHELNVIDRQRYYLMLPGMGRLPNSWLWHMQLMTLERPWLSARGSELLLLLQKADMA